VTTWKKRVTQNSTIANATELLIDYQEKQPQTHDRPSNAE